MSGNEVEVSRVQGGVATMVSSLTQACNEFMNCLYLMYDLFYLLVLAADQELEMVYLLYVRS